MMEKSMYVQTPDEVSTSGGVQPTPRVRQSRSPKPNRKVHISKIEKLLYSFFALTILALLILVIAAKNGYSASQQNLQDVNQNVEKIHNDNGNLKQEISELQSSSRLQNIAQKNGLSLSNNNIRNVRK
ncbi:cell division protein FtsL [Lactobacillaceae bacterium Melli_B4]